MAKRKGIKSNEKLMREKHAGCQMFRKDVSRRIFCILLAVAVLVVQLCIPGVPGTSSARAAEASAVTTASAGNAASGMKVTHSVSIPKSGDKTAEITIDLQSNLQVKKHTDTVFVFDCSAMANIEEQKSVVKEVAQELLTDGATRFALVKYSNNAETALDFTNNYAAFAAAVDALSVDANANAYAGLQIAKEVLDARGNAANEANIVIVSAQGCNFNASRAEALSREIRDGGISIYGLLASVYSGEMKNLCSEIFSSSANGVGTKLAVTLCASPLYQNISIEGSLSEKFNQRGNISVYSKYKEVSLSDRFEGAEAVYENNRYTINIPKWYAGESVSLTLHADMCDRRETGVIPVTGELLLRADNLAQVSAAALSINRTGYSVIYGTGSGTGSVPEDSAIHAEGGTVALKDKPADLKKDGQNFSGWGASGGVNIRDGSFTMPGSDVTLQALWGRAYIQKRTNTVTQEPTRRMRNRQAIGYTNSFYASAYKNYIQSITFLNTNEMPAGAVAAWDITDTNFGTAGSVMAAVVANESDASKYDLYIGAKGGVEAPADSLSLFSGFSSLTTVKNASYFDTWNVTNMRAMFSNCMALTTLDISGWNTSNVTNMDSMFSECQALATLNVSEWNTENVTNMFQMFYNCKELARLDVSRWKTGNVTDMYGMFYRCSKLATLDVSGWDTSNVTKMKYLFYGCSALATLNVSNWKTGNVTNMGCMFSGCEALTTLNVSGWDILNVTDMSSMFYGCRALKKLDAGGWDTSGVTDMGSMFYNCEALTTPPVSGWDTSNVTDMRSMFSGCDELATLDVSNWDTSSVTDMGHLFSGCSKLATLDVSNWDTSSVTDMGLLCYGCSALANLNVSNWDTSSVTDMDRMFNFCYVLTNLDVSNWDTSNVRSMRSMFADCSVLANLDVSGWDTSNVTKMEYLFYGCSALATLNVSNWKTGNVTDMGLMFYDCRALESLDVSGWETENVTDMENMFNSCVSLSGIGKTQLTVANGCTVTDWNKSASNALTAVTIKAVDGTVLYQGTATASLSAVAMFSAEERRETDSHVGKTAEENSSDKKITEENSSDKKITEELAEESTEQAKAAGQTRETRANAVAEQTGAERASEALSASVKNGVTEGGKLTAGQKVEYELELQYIGDEGGRSGELVVTDNIPAGMTYNGDASVSSVQRIDGGIGNILGTVTMAPAVSGNTLIFKVTGLSAGAKIVVTYSCNAPESEPAAYTEYINTASVNDSGLTDEADPVRHYMQKKPSAFYDVTYRYSGRTIPDGVAVPGRMGVVQGGSVTLPVPAVNGWIFNGWKASGTVVSGTYTPTADVTLIGTWTKIPEDEIKYVNINYSFQNAPLEGDAILADIREEALTRAEQNQTVSLPKMPSVDGYNVTWTGVSADASGKYNVGTADTINVVGVWTKQKYNVSYRFDGMIPSGAAVPATKEYEWGDTVRLAAMADKGAYTFAGWTGAAMKTDSTFEMPKNDVTLVGRWMAKSILIKPNGGVWSGSTDESVCDYTENIGDIEKPVMERFTFKKWSEGAGDSTFAKVLTAKWNPAVAAEDFSYHILKPELTADIAKKLADVAAVDADGNPTDVITVNAKQLADIQAARTNKKNGDFPLTFTTDGAEKTITVTLYGAFTVSAQDYSGTYDRQAHSGTVTVSGLTDYSIKYRTEADGAYTLEEEPSYTDVGTYTYYYQVTEGGNETEENQTAEGSVTVSIAPKSLTDDSIVVTVTPSETEYKTGEAITPAVTVKDGDTVLTEGTDYTLSGDLTKTEIGIYTIDVAGKGNYKDCVNATWEITLTKMKGITVDGYEGSYDGAEHGISIKLSGTSEGAAVKYGTSKDNCSLGVSPTYTDAGEYVVYYEIAKDGYKTEKGSAKVVIYKAEQEAPDVSATNETIKGRADGALAGVTSAMEYRREGEDAYKAIAGTEIKDLSSGIYYVRYQATRNYSVSPDKKVEVGSGRMLAVTLPGKTEQKGYRITADKEEACWHEKVTLTFDLNSGYDPAETQVAVTNGALAKISDTRYEITDIEADTVVTVTVRDTTAPEGKISISDRMFWEEMIYADWDMMFVKGGQTVKITAADEGGSGIRSIRYAYICENYSQEEFDAAKDSIDWQAYSQPVVLDKETGYMYAEITDNAGNVTYICTDELVKDDTDPKIRGVEDHKTYCEAKTVTVTDEHLDTVTVNGTEVTLTDGTYALVADGTVYTIIATDKAGNTTTVTVKVNNGHTFPEQWTVEKEATEKEPGRQYKVCKICGIKIYQTIEPTETVPDDPDAGKIQKEVMVLPGAPDTVLNNSKAELAEVLTPEEKAEVNEGVDAKIWLEVSPAEDIAPSDREKVEKAAEAVVGTGTEVMYFDASLFKRVGDGGKMSISEPGRPISVTVVIPEEIRNKDVLMVRNYRIIRLHEGETDVIEGTYDEETAEFTFESDKFSTYAICYKDTPRQVEPTPTPPEPTPTPGETTQPGTATPAPGGTPQLGITTSTPVPNEDGQTGNQIEKRKDLSILLAVGKQKGKNSIGLTWLKCKGASGYEVYWSYCDGKKNYKKISNVKASGKRAFVHKKLKVDRAYKYYIAAYKMEDGKKQYIAKSPTIHVAMKYEKRTNVKKITVNKAKVTLRPKNKFQIRAKTVLWNKKKKVLKHVEALRYYTENKKVAMVSKKGKITAKGKGTCTVYVIANNGVAKKIKVKVK